MKNSWSIFLLLLGFGSHLYSKSFMCKANDHFLSDIRADDLQLIDFYCKPNSKSKDTCIALLRDNKNRFILKQKLDFSFLPVIEKLGSYIANSVNISANQVEIIPSNHPFVGKKEVDLPASLHSFVSGMQARYLSKHFNQYSVCLKQMVGIEKILGFTRRLVNYMSLHEDFAKIIALDTFVANYDRHKGNFFYNKKTDHFSVIDFGCSFQKNLAEDVYQSFVSMAKDKKLFFSPEEIKGLIAYRDMLKRLINKYDQITLIAKFNALIDEAQIDITQKKAYKRKERHSQIMMANYNSCNKVIDIVDILIKKHDG